MSSITAPHCSSGIESGWTLYLHDDNDENESSFVSVARRIPGSCRSRRRREEEEEEEDNENLSMLSDASSGPPYYEVKGWSGHGFRAGSELNAQNKDKRQPSRDRHLHYEDTASSCQKNFNQPAKNHASTRHALDFPRDYLIPNLEEKPEYGNSYHNLQPHAADQNSGSRRAGHSRKLM